jgi:hypothetical protein
VPTSFVGTRTGPLGSICCIHPQKHVTCGLCLLYFSLKKYNSTRDWVVLSQFSIREIVSGAGYVILRCHTGLHFPYCMVFVSIVHSTQALLKILLRLYFRHNVPVRHTTGEAPPSTVLYGARSGELGVS